MSQNLSRNEFQLKNILNLIPTPVILVEAGTARVTFANKAADKLAGGNFPKGKPGEKYDTVYWCFDKYGKRIPNNKMPGVRAARGEVLRNFQMDWDTTKGRRSLLVNSDEVAGEDNKTKQYILTFQDITELKQVEAEHKKIEEKGQASERRYRTMFEQSPFSIQIFTPDGITIHVNKAWEKLWGVSSEQIKGYNVLKDKQLVKSGSMPFIKKGFKGQPSIIPAIKYEPNVTIPGVSEVPYLWVRAFIYPVKNASGKITEVVLMHEDITSQKTAEEKLHYRTALLEAQNEATPDGILIVDQRGKMLSYNRRFAQMWKMPKKIMNSKDDEAALKFAMTQLENPKDFIDRVNYLYTKSKADEVSHEEFKFKDGRVFYRYGAPIVNEQGQRYGWAWHFRDITKRKNNEKSLLRQSRVLESMAEGVSVTDENGIIVFTNPAEDKMFGYKRGELIGKHVMVQNAYPPKENARRVSQVIKTLKSKGVWFGEWENKRKDGTKFQTSARISSIEMDGKRFWICVQEDITKRKLAERKAADLTLQRKELLSLNKAKDDFISLASHQLRTPATGVKQYLRLVLDGYADGEISVQNRAMLEVAYESNQRQLLIIDDLLKVAGVDSGKVSIKKDTFDLLPVIKNIINEQSEQFKQRNQKITFSPKYKKIPVYADKGKIRMVLENIIDNAGKYTNIGKSVQIDIIKLSKHIDISVKDQGVGIAKKDIDKLFQKFSRIDNPLSIAVGGTGLGLYLAKKIIDLHGGKIKVKTAAGSGTEFIISLPVETKISNGDS